MVRSAKDLPITGHPAEAIGPCLSAALAATDIVLAYLEVYCAMQDGRCFSRVVNTTFLWIICVGSIRRERVTQPLIVAISEGFRIRGRCYQITTFSTISSCSNNITGCDFLANQLSFCNTF